MTKEIKKNVWQFVFNEFGSCVYLIKLKNKNILIDTSSTSNKEELIEYLRELNLDVKDVNIVILTHNHWDHVGNIDLFPNAKIYGSKEDFKDEKILDIDKLNIKEFEIIKTPGHSKGSFCILYEDILFSGDTIFHNGGIGRMDIPGGSEQDMRKSLEKLKKINYKILCPGHV